MHQLKNIIQEKKKKNEEEVEKNKLVQDNKDDYRIDQNTFLFPFESFQCSRGKSKKKMRNEIKIIFK